MPKYKNQFFTSANVKAVRAAFKAGKRTVVLNERRFNIQLKARSVTFVVGGQMQKRTEKWLIVTPADGKVGPVGNIELTDQANLRSAVKVES